MVYVFENEKEMLGYKPSYKATINNDYGVVLRTEGEFRGQLDFFKWRRHYSRKSYWMWNARVYASDMYETFKSVFT